MQEKKTKKYSLRFNVDEMLFTISGDEFSIFLGRLVPLVFLALYDPRWLSVANLSTIDSNSP